MTPPGVADVCSIQVPARGVLPYISSWWGTQLRLLRAKLFRSTACWRVVPLSRNMFACNKPSYIVLNTVMHRPWTRSPMWACSLREGGKLTFLCLEKGRDFIESNPLPKFLSSPFSPLPASTGFHHNETVVTRYTMPKNQSMHTHNTQIQVNQRNRSEIRQRATTFRTQHSLCHHHLHTAIPRGWVGV